MPDLIVSKMRYPVKGILFDKDGTLLDFIRLWGYWSESLYRHYAGNVPGGRIAPLSELLGTIHDSAGRVADYNRNGPLSMGSVGDVLAILAWQGYRSGLAWSAAMRLAWESKRLADKELERVRPAYPLPGLVPFLQQCRDQGLRMGIVTADETADAEKHLEWMEIRPFFQTVIGNDRVKLGKPDPEMVERACVELGLAPGETALIGDTDGDMQMGNSAGVAVTIGLLGEETEQSIGQSLHHAVVTVSSYADLRLEASRDEG